LSTPCRRFVSCHRPEPINKSPEEADHYNQPHQLVNTKY
jgi:hypothetical protein